MPRLSLRSKLLKAQIPPIVHAMKTAMLADITGFGASTLDTLGARGFGRDQIEAHTDAARRLAGAEIRRRHLQIETT